MSPVPSHDALQYLPSAGCGHEQHGFLQVFSSAITSSPALFGKNGLNNGAQSLTQSRATPVSRIGLFWLRFGRGPRILRAIPQAGRQCYFTRGAAGPETSGPALSGDEDYRGRGLGSLGSATRLKQLHHFGLFIPAGHLQGGFAILVLNRQIRTRIQQDSYDFNFIGMH